MIKVKKALSLAIVVFLILSNLAFAISDDVKFEFDENFVDDKREAVAGFHGDRGEMHAGSSMSDENEVMQRFMKGEMSEEQMRSMAKAKFGDKFSEMEFRKRMHELEERMKRKETFSYEHEGYQSRYYHPGPSYEGYSKEHMIFGMVFEQIGDDIDPREIKQHCREPEKIADIVISKLKEKTGYVQKLCSRMEEQEVKCAEYSKRDCSRIGMPFVREDATEMEKLDSVAYSCPPNKDAIIEACKRRSMSYMEKRIENADEECKRRFDFEGERLVKECERFRESNACDKEKFMDKCLGGIKRDDFENKEHKFVCGNNICEEGEADSRGCWDPNVEMPCRPGTCPQDCEKPEKACPKPTCEGAEDTGNKDSRGCPIYACPTTEILNTTVCPLLPPQPPCPEGTTSKPTYDTNGCLIGQRCEQKLHPYGCDAIVTKPTCAEGQILIAAYDGKGCIVGYECFIQPTSNGTSTTGSAIRITGNVVLSDDNYDDFLRRCEDSWSRQQGMCERMEGQACDKSSFIEKCAEMQKINYQDFSSKIGYNCESQTTAQLEHAEQRCSTIEEDRQRCSEDAAERCEHMKGLAQKCKELLTEESIRKFIVEEAKKRCKFIGIIEDEEEVRKAESVEVILAVLSTVTDDDIEKLSLFVDELKEELRLRDTIVYKGTIEPKSFGDIKLFPFVVNAKISAIASSETAKEAKARIIASQKVEEAAGRLASLRDADVPSQFLYIIEDKASDVLDVSGSLEDIEKKEGQKGVGYKIRLFLGLAKEAEKVEIGQLEDSREKLRASIEALTKLADEVPSDVAKAILKEQVESLKKQQENIDVLIKTKEKKSKGLLGLFG